MLRRTVRLMAGCCAMADTTIAGTVTHAMVRILIISFPSIFSKQKNRPSCRDGLIQLLPGMIQMMRAYSLQTRISSPDRERPGSARQHDKQCRFAAVGFMSYRWKLEPRIEGCLIYDHPARIEKPLSGGFLFVWRLPLLALRGSEQRLWRYPSARTERVAASVVLSRLTT